MGAQTPDDRRLAEVIAVVDDEMPLWLAAEAAAMTPGDAAEAADAMVIAGLLDSAEIAAELVVTPHTVRFHLGRVYRKLGVSGREDLGAALD